MSRMLDREIIKAYFPEAGWLLAAEEINSTNTVAKELAAQGAPEGTLVIAERQTGGRGRLGREFQSPRGGIYMSIIMRPQGTLEQCAMLTMAACVGVCRALERLLDISPGIKWVNDIYYKGKKVCGILAEGAAAGDRLKYAVIGVGINYQSPEFQGGLANRAGSLYPDMEPPISLSAMAGAAASEVYRACRDFQTDTVYAEYRNKSLLIGKAVALSDGRQGQALDITREGRLLVNIAGETVEQNSGEVSAFWAL